MRYAVFSDVHANLEALEAVLTALAAEKIDRFLCCGDMVGYGANPRECMVRLKSLEVIAVGGNHDLAAAGVYEDANFSPSARTALAWTKTHLKDEEKTFLKGLPLVFQENDLVMVHGTLHEPENFYYMDNWSDAEMTFRLLKKDVCFVGHNHSPAIIVQKQDRISFLTGYSMVIAPGEKYIVNVGSVGQPRDGKPEAAFCVYDASTGSIEIKRVAYPVAVAQNKILKAGLPASLAHRLGPGF